MKGTKRPASLDDWRTCWLEAHSLEDWPEEEARDLGPDPGSRIEPGRRDRALLVIHTVWAESAFRTENVSGELVVELSLPIQENVAQRVEVGRSEYSQGGLGWVHSTKVRGVVTPVKIERGWVTLRLELEATKPNASWPRLVETVAARRKNNVRQCYFD